MQTSHQPPISCLKLWANVYLGFYNTSTVHIHKICNKLINHFFIIYNVIMLIYLYLYIYMLLLLKYNVAYGYIMGLLLYHTYKSIIHQFLIFSNS